MKCLREFFGVKYFDLDFILSLDNSKFITSYFNYCYAVGYDKNTYNNRIGALRRYCNFLIIKVKISKKLEESKKNILEEKFKMLISATCKQEKVNEIFKRNVYRGNNNQQKRDCGRIATSDEMATMIELCLKVLNFFVKNDVLSLITQVTQRNLLKNCQRFLSNLFYLGQMCLILIMFPLEGGRR